MGTRASGSEDSRSLPQRYADVKERIAQAAERSGRAGSDVVLVAVTKYAGIDAIRTLIELGHEDFGESRVQNLEKRVAVVNEFLQRHRDMPVGKAVSIPERVRWHMIGHLQRNKARKIVKHVRLVHSVDSLRLVEELHAAAGRVDEPIELLIQVKLDNEKKKHGVAPAAVIHLLDQIDTMIGLRARGLMCMAPEVEDPETVRPVFVRCAELFEEIRRVGAGGERFDILSMGMSNDFEVAIECGANVVRVGSAIFGSDSSVSPDEA